MKRRAIVLLSGGLDSTTTLAIALEQGFEVCGLSFRYGQRHEAELRAAARISQHYGLGDRHRIIQLDESLFAGSALTSEAPVPKDRHPEGAQKAEIPTTYVPARNTVMLSMALAYSEVIDASDIFIGVTAVDYSGYPDCRPEYMAAFQALAALATRSAIAEDQAVQIQTPLIALSKAEIIRQGQALGAPYALTLSCYDPDAATDAACGHCDACYFRATGFQEAGIADPTSYAPTA